VAFTTSEKRILLLLIALLGFGYLVELAGWETPPADPIPAAASERHRPEDGSKRLPPLEESPFREGKLDLNAADGRALESLPGVGPALAERILASRRDEGPFRRPEDLLRVRGIGPKTLASIRPLLADPDSASPGAAQSPGKIPPVSAETAK
jgi:competence ComEA-like helix-hairpin-helix protein